MKILTQGNLNKILSKTHKVVYVSTYSFLKKNIQVLNKRKFGVVVLDEAHMIKNEKSKLSQCMKDLDGDLRLGLTGTPI